jgi:hypothetical protein
MINFNHSAANSLTPTPAKLVFLSDHFTLFEMIKSQTAIQLGLDNTPDDQTILALRHVCHEILEPVRKQFRRPFSPLSGFRSFKLNSAVGGSQNSQHLKGLAVDIELAGVDNYVLAKWIMENLVFDQLVLEFYHLGQPRSGWVHVSIVDDNNEGKHNRRQVLTRNTDHYCSGLVV